ncbi:MAG: sulfatase [Thermoguttaceae bacterium]|nr:sulfatase [Thermoguttaceae bacterium]MDW8077682.1 sulfatase [Thermoguttaceae bacterium]
MLGVFRPLLLLPFVALQLAAGILLANEEPSAPANCRRPNVVFIITDDQRWDFLSCAGHPFLKTPNIDRLAREGVRFVNAFVTTSLCSPSRASFLSGLYAHTHGVLNNFTDYPRDLPSFPRRLQQLGYHTAYIGKWHMGEEDDSPRPGFDHWASHRGQGVYFDNEFNINGRREIVPGYYTHVITQMAEAWLRQARRPFLLCLGHKAPHTPFTPEEKYRHVFDHLPIYYPWSAFHLEGKPQWVRDRLVTWHGIYGPLFGFRESFPDTSAAGMVDFARFVRAYAATLLSVDDSVGTIYETLRQLGELDHTLIIYTSDNGMLLGEHGMTDKRTMHEPSIRIPLIMRYPPLIRPGTVVEEMVLNIDIAPTILEMCGAPPLEKVHGQSVVPLFRGEKVPWRDAWYYEYNYEKQFPYTPNVRGIRTKKWKYIRYPHGDGGPDRHKAELYDLENDPQELVNLVDEPKCRDIVAELERRLYKLQAETGALPDVMPIDEGIKTQLPEEKIR